MGLSAAELQKRHNLEGAPDPFPSLGAPKASAPAPATATSTAATSNGSHPANANVDTSEDAFPSLGSSTAPAQALAKPASSMWASKPLTVKSTKSKPAPAGGLGRTGAPTATSHPHTDSFSIPANELATGKTVQETIKKVIEQTGAMVESATQMQTGLRTFHIKAADPKRLAYARRLIERGLSKPISLEVEVPVTTIGTIIGPKGATLKGITDSTQTKIDIPRRDTLPAYEPTDDSDDEEPSAVITINGPSAACTDAKNKILALISHKTTQTSTSIKTIPSSYYPFIAGPKGSRARQLEEELGEGQVKVHVPPPAVWKALEKQGEEEEVRDLSIKVKGDKEKVKLVVTDILRQFEELTDNLRELKISIPKRQHRFLVGSAADDILDQTQCIVELPPVDDSSDQCVIRGAQANLIPALTLVMDKANAVAVEMVDVVALHRVNTSDPAHAKNVLRFLQRSSRLRAIGEEHGVKVFPPFASAIASGHVVIEVVGEDKSNVAKAKEQVGAAVKAITPANIAIVSIDPLVHSLLIGKKGSKIAQFESANNVTTVFPPEADESSDVLVVFTGDKAQAKTSLAAATEALGALAKDAADIKTETLQVDKKFHGAIIGPGGTVLNALIGDNVVKVQVDDEITIRGPSGEVDRIAKQILQIVEDAKNDDIINGHTAEFTVDKKHVPHLVGSGGSTINKLRETLGVKVNFDDDKGKVQCKIVGRKEAVEEARKRLVAQIEKLQDETSETITIKRAIQPALIGSGGKYAIRLEEKYGVKLSFPRDNKESDEVSIRGGRKGVAQAKAELLEAAAYEAESRQSATFTVPTRAVSQIVGKSGATINGIKDETGAQIDIDKNPDGGKTTITLRGDKKAIAAAKTAILAVADAIGEETTVEIEIEHKYHRTLIGQGGAKLRELIVAAGGPEEGYKQAGLVTFPKGEPSDTVKLRGDKTLVSKVKAELEKQVATLRETKVVGVVVPKDQHAGKIGRGGMALNALQRESGAVIHFPGSRQYASVGEIENADAIEGADAADIVKVIGTKEAIAKATESLQVAIAARTEREPRTSTPDASRTVPIPAKFYFAIADQNVRQQVRGAGGFLNAPAAPPKPEITDAAAKSARIDVDAENDTEGEWELRENYTGAPEGTLDWVVKGKEQDLDKAVKVLEEAVGRAEKATHVGLLTGLPRSTFPRIIGTKGSTISRLRIETGADIQVGRDTDLITITGDAASVQQAREAILSIVKPGRY